MLIAPLLPLQMRSLFWLVPVSHMHMQLSRRSWSSLYLYCPTLQSRIVSRARMLLSSQRRHALHQQSRKTARTGPLWHLLLEGVLFVSNRRCLRCDRDAEERDVTFFLTNFLKYHNSV